MADITLAGITLPGDLYWSDEFTSWKVGQTVKFSLTGAPIIQESSLQAGRSITLESTQDTGGAWVAPLTLQQLEQLRALEADVDEGPFTLVMPDHNSGTRNFTVRFKRDGGKAIEARPIKFIVPYVDANYFATTLRLIQV